MKRKAIFNILFYIVLMAISLGLLLYIQWLFTPKFYRDQWKTTSVYDNFYRQDKNSLQVLFIGSSYGSTSFIPQALYNEFGYTSYNLCCEQQSLVTTYYWLKEAFKYQNPSVVVLETGMLYSNLEDSVIESPEGLTRAALDPMRWSWNKWSAVRNICMLDNSHQLISYILPFYRYHDRWKDLSQDDFLFGDVDENKDLRGYIYLDDKLGESDYNPIYDDPTHKEDMQPLMEKYFYKILELCSQKGCHLLLTRIPTSGDTYGAFNSTKELSDELGLVFVDYNEYRFYMACGYDYGADNQDNSHPNIHGAKKLTGYTGRILKEVYGLKPQNVPGFEHTKPQWKTRLKNDSDQ